MSLKVRFLILAITLSVGSPQTGVAQNAPTNIFTFRSGFWVNLHHFLYVLGRAANEETNSQRRAVVNAPRDLDGFEAIPDSDKRAWQEAIAFYGAGLSQKDAVFDAEMMQVTRALADAGNAPGIDAIGLEADFVEVLSRVAPIYRAVWWTRHERSNREVIGGFEVLIARYGDSVLKRLEQVYNITWPPDGLQIDVAAYTNWAGAYSTSRFGSLIMMASTDESTSGPMGIESMFHESLHQWDNEVSQKLRPIATELGVRVPRNLSHTMIFHTAGELIGEQITDHRPYAEEYGLWERAWPEHKPVLDEHWLPYLRGERTFREAVEAMIRALTQ